MDGDLRPPTHALRLLRPHEVGDEPGFRPVGGHHDLVAATKRRLLDDSLAGLPRGDNVAIGLDSLLPKPFHRIRHMLPLCVPFALVRQEARDGDPETGSPDPGDREDADRNLALLGDPRGGFDRPWRNRPSFGSEQNAAWAPRRLRRGGGAAGAAPPNTCQTCGPGMTSPGGSVSGGCSCFLSSILTRYQ